MKENIQLACNSESTNYFSIKATTTDYLGFIGEKKGIAAISTCLIIKE